jgi:hypothetical protein
VFWKEGIAVLISEFPEGLIMSVFGPSIKSTHSVKLLLSKTISECESQNNGAERKHSIPGISRYKKPGDSLPQSTTDIQTKTRVRTPKPILDILTAVEAKQNERKTRKIVDWKRVEQAGRFIFEPHSILFQETERSDRSHLMQSILLAKKFGVDLEF